MLNSKDHDDGQGWDINNETESKFRTRSIPLGLEHSFAFEKDKISFKVDTKRKYQAKTFFTTWSHLYPTHKVTNLDLNNLIKWIKTVS